jgi:hypothetical protein
MKQKEYHETYSLAQNAPYQSITMPTKEHRGSVSAYAERSASSRSTLGS